MNVLPHTPSAQTTNTWSSAMLMARLAKSKTSHATNVAIKAISPKLKMKSGVFRTRQLAKNASPETRRYTDNTLIIIEMSISFSGALGGNCLNVK